MATAPALFFCRIHRIKHRIEASRFVMREAQARGLSCGSLALLHPGKAIVLFIHHKRKWRGRLNVRRCFEAGQKFHKIRICTWRWYICTFNDRQGSRDVRQVPKIIKKGRHHRGSPLALLLSPCVLTETVVGVNEIVANRVITLLVL